ncbi:hypothetical protein GLOIN_2v333148 [Rhizophagus irregularis DAOM 181602=DAOM 197198]|uniref:Uncharacterized protein n=4 Tax=Rhizophagus irregularis TaxID=588596 RepID=A0A2P4PMZ8_RHIID|nr:hypothetical protein GLOIN_2v333148 [Rhizophagus irregularis DAOM 181602=DAOM 197198]POG66744.1 hypothetical protein GLOIN_2v333148 [Rhizophagus irregularis DAOM 181602=DAOM 197198]|eukprot:XP_025173610.1 hypothetical protein GLOIN_2v333148 [Rhizophagus irregularis DAOM 181602=DAOM 197198]
MVKVCLYCFLICYRLCDILFERYYLNEMTYQKVKEKVNEIRKLKSELTKIEEELSEHNKVANENFEKLQRLRTEEDDKKYKSKIYDEAEKWDKKNSERENLKLEQEESIDSLIKYATRKRDYWNDVINLHSINRDFDKPLSKMPQKIKETINEIRKLKSELIKKEKELFEHDKKLQRLRRDDKKHMRKRNKKNSEYKNLKFDLEKLIEFLIICEMQKRDYWKYVILHAKNRNFDEPLSKIKNRST